VRGIYDDVLTACRSISRSPKYVAFGVTILALGFAVTGAVFSMVNGLLSSATAIPMRANSSTWP
jgi:hypothetical protein